MVLLCCRFSRVRAPGLMHLDDWCICQQYAYRMLHFVGPELWGGVWPGPPRGWRGALPGLSPRPVRRVPPRLPGEGGAAGGGCVRCAVGGLRAVRHDGGHADGVHALPRGQLLLGQAGKCQKLHYPAHKMGCRAALAARDSGATW